MQPIAWTNWILASQEADAEFQRWSEHFAPRGAG